MRILYVTASLPYASAAEEFFVPEINALKRLGHEVLLVPRSAAGGLSTEADALEVEVSAEPLLSGRVLSGFARAAVRSPGRVARAFRRLADFPSRVLAENLAVLGKAFWVSELAKTWAADHIHAQWAHTTATIGLIAAAEARLPWSFTAHRGDIVANNLLAEKLRACAFARFISDSGLRLAVELCGPVAEERGTVIRMGIDLPEPPGAELAARPDRPFTVFCAANLIPVKGHTYLLQAMAMLRDRGFSCRLQLAGQGPLLPQLQEQVKRLRLTEACSFLGQLPRREILRRYRDGLVDLFVLPSLDLGRGQHEGVPVSLMEAMSHAIPVVSTATGGIPELLCRGAGWIVPDKDEASLAEAIEGLGADVELRRRFGTEGRRAVERRHDAVKAMQKLVKRMGMSDGRDY